MSVKDAPKTEKGFTDMKQAVCSAISSVFFLSFAVPAIAEMNNPQPSAVNTTADERSVWRDVRVSLRGAYDRNRQLDRSMNAVGLEVAGVQRWPQWDRFLIEGGATASVMGDNDDAFTGTNGHATIFPALDFGGIVFGPRLLAGASWEEETDKVRPDIGGEGRLGLQADTYLVFLSAGRTLELTRIGMDIGATF